MTWDLEMQKRNAPYTDEQLDQILPTEGYEIIQPPPGYKPLRAPSYQSITPRDTPLYEVPESVIKPY